MKNNKALIAEIRSKLDDNPADIGAALNIPVATVRAYLNEQDRADRSSGAKVDKSAAHTDLLARLNDVDGVLDYLQAALKAQLDQETNPVLVRELVNVVKAKLLALRERSVLSTTPGEVKADVTIDNMKTKVN